MAQKIPFFELFTDFSPDFDLRVPLNAAVVTNMVLEPEKRTMTLDMTVRAEMTDSTRETVEQMLARSYDLKRVDIHVKSTAEAFPDMMKNAGRKVSGSGSVIMGREIAKGRVLPISELTPKAGHVVVEGKVFKFDCHETRRAGGGGKARGAASAHAHVQHGRADRHGRRRQARDQVGNARHRHYRPRCGTELPGRLAYRRG